MKYISDFLTAEQIQALSGFIPRTREEYQRFTQLAYNLKLNTKIPLTVHIEP